MSTTLVLGSAVGDEGKGKITDYLAEKSDVIVRYAGGANAGHTLVVGDKKYITHSLPSGVLYEGKDLVLANGMVLNLRALTREIAEFKAAGFLGKNRLFISHLAHIVLPYHIILDEHREKTQKIGTTKQGIGPAYESKIGRIGVRVCDLFSPARLKELVQQNYSAMIGEVLLEDKNEYPKVEEITEELTRLGNSLKPYITDTREFLRSAISAGKNILLESAQGVLLDTDHGQYPFVTSSPTVSAGALLGTGLNYRDLDRVIGVSKAYTTRIAAGPLPAEMPEEEQAKWREHGGEYGATTGRPRRIGWLDLPILRYAVEMNGFTDIALTKVDALRGMGPIKICRGYKLKDGGTRTVWAPEMGEVEPIYDELKPFEAPVLENGNLHNEYEAFACYIERDLGIPVSIVSHGAGREDTFVRMV